MRLAYYLSVFSLILSRYDIQNTMLLEEVKSCQENATRSSAGFQPQFNAPPLLVFVRHRGCIWCSFKPVGRSYVYRAKELDFHMDSMLYDPHGGQQLRGNCSINDCVCLTIFISFISA